MYVPMAKKLRAFMQMQAEERMLFLRAVMLMEAIQLALGLVPFQRIVRVLNAMRQRYAQHPGSRRIAIRRAARRLGQAAQYCPIPADCLAQTLAAKVLIQRYGYTGKVCIGVLKSEEDLKAHAWLECPEGVFIGNPMPESKAYVPLQGAERLAG
jgi:hypothetical protein